MSERGDEETGGEENSPEKQIVEEIEEDLDIFDELNKSYNSMVDSGFGDYTQDVQRFANVPHDQFSHAHSLINPISKKMAKEGFDVITDPSVLLGNIDNEKSLRMYQIDVFFLTNMLSCALHDEMMQVVFEPLWTVFKSEMRITSTIGGLERAYQAFHLPVYAGSKKKGFKILGKRKKKREPIDYVIPQEEDEGIY